MSEQVYHNSDHEHHPDKVRAMLTSQALVFEQELFNGSHPNWTIIPNAYDTSSPQTGPTLLHAEAVNFPDATSEGNRYVFECLPGHVQLGFDPAHAAVTFVTFGIRDYEGPYEHTRLVRIFGDGNIYWSEKGGNQPGVLFDNEPLASVGADISKKVVSLAMEMNFIPRNPQHNF